MYRVWSTDWFNNPDRESARMLAWLEKQCRHARLAYEARDAVSDDTVMAAQQASVRLGTADEAAEMAPMGPKPLVQHIEQDGFKGSDGEEAAADEEGPQPRGRHRQLDGIIDYYELDPGWFEIWIAGRPVGEVERMTMGDSGPARIYGGRLKIAKPRFRGSFLNSEVSFETDDIYEAIRRVARECAEPRRRRELL